MPGLFFVLAQSPATVPSEEKLAEARALAFDRRYEEALQQFRAILAFDPDEPLINYYVGITLWKLERFKAARLYFQRSIDLEAPYPEPYLWLARTEVKLSDPESAREVVGFGLQKFPRHEELLELQALLASPP